MASPTPPTSVPEDEVPLPELENRRYTIEHALDLEHQLNEESEDDEPRQRATSTQIDPTTLDPDVLATIVIQQRASLAQLTTERDGLESALAKAHIVQSDLQSQLADVVETLEVERQKCVSLALELGAARERATNDAESISMLRSKVEESRRGVMRLQSERETRRMSQFQPLQLDLAAANSTANARTPGFSTFSKRASVISTTTSNMTTPRSPTFLTHRRVSSLSDPGMTPDTSDTLSWSHAMGHTPSEPATSSVGRSSALSPPSMTTPSLSPPPLITEEELSSLQSELSKLRRDLAQAKEAKEASDTVLRALREMIGVDPESKELPNAEQVESLKGLSLPPLPTDDLEDEESPAPPLEEKKSGWGLRLWRTGPVPPVKPISPDLSSLKSDAASDTQLDSSKRSSASSAPQTDSPSLTRTTSASSFPPPAPPPRQPLFRTFGWSSAAPAPPVPEKDLPPVNASVLGPAAEIPEGQDTLPDLPEEVASPETQPDLHILTDVLATGAELQVHVQPPTAVESFEGK